MGSPILTGQTREHVEAFDNVFVHSGIVAPLKKMREAAKKEGIDLQLTSGFRDFTAQLKIWNQKCRGERAILDKFGIAMDRTKLSDEQTVFAILRWSALPGMSRHHWGTDFDVYDKASMPKDYKVQLIPQEAAPGGVFHPLATWIAKHIASFGFFRPYEQDLGGISPEWWHLSYASLAQSYFEAHDISEVKHVVTTAEMELQDVVLKHLPRIYQTYFQKICLP